jgi:ubiquinone/menaquinone biosynthesis C-methylase UbiE
MTKKQFICPTGSLDVLALMDQQKAGFEIEKATALARGVDLMAERTSRYLARWREALAKVHKGANFLDIGSGWLPEPIFNLIINDWDLKYHAFDVDPIVIQEMIERMAAVGRPASNFAAGETSCLPYEKKFDFVFSSHCLEHATDIVATLAEIRRVLTDGGGLFMSVHLGFDLSDEHLLFLGQDEWVCLLSYMGYDIISSTIGTVYSENADITIHARQRDSMSLDMQSASNLALRFSKANSIFLPHNNPAFHYPKGSTHTDTESIIRAQKARCLLNIPGHPKALIVIRHPWSGCMRISDDNRDFALDCYSPVHYRHAIDLTSFGADINIEIVGSNPLSKGDEGVICGVLFDE